MRKFLSGVVFAAVVGAMGLAGCGSKPAATCENAAEHIKKLMTDSPEMQKASPEEKKMTEELMKNLVGELAKECKDKKWDDKQLGCIMAATKVDQLDKCNVQK
jgi:outer membrane murein-binding lipoprotein Lpp